MKKTTSKGIDDFLGFERGTFDHIPHYCREDAIEAIRTVKKLEGSKLFRPGLYYIVLSDLCRSTEASGILGADLNRIRVETFITKCIESLGWIEPENYFLPIREVGDAVLILFSSFRDAFHWWAYMESWLDTQNGLSAMELTSKQFNAFFLEAKTVIHAGEVSYSDGKNPVALSINQIFKIEKLFKAGELGITNLVRTTANPIITSLGLRPRLRKTLQLPGSSARSSVYVAAKARNKQYKR